MHPRTPNPFYQTRSLHLPQDFCGGDWKITTTRYIYDVVAPHKLLQALTGDILYRIMEGENHGDGIEPISYHRAKINRLLRPKRDVR